MEEACLWLAEAQRNKLAEREKYRLERETARELSLYHQPAPGGSNPARPPPGAPAIGAPPPPIGHTPPPDQPRIIISPQARDANGLPLYSTLMDNIVAADAVIANLDVQGDGALQIQYAKALLVRAVEQQAVGVDPRGRMYSRSLASKAASSGHPTVTNTLTCPPPQPLTNQPRAANPALSTNEPRPANNTIAVNGQPLDARTNIINNQAWRARQPNDLRHTLTNRGDPEPRGSLSRVGPQCFGPMIRGKKYPANFKAPKEIENYDPTYDPAVWLDTYLMEMGIAGHTDLLAARYLP